MPREDQAVLGPRGGDVDEPAALLGLGLALGGVEVDQLPEAERVRAREREPHPEPARAVARSGGRS